MNKVVAGGRKSKEKKTKMVGIFLHDLLPLTTVQTIPYRHLSFSLSRPLPTTSTIPTSLGLGCYSFLWSHLSSFVFSSIFSYLLDLSLQKRTNLLSFSQHVFNNMNNNNNISMGFSCGSHYYDGEEPEVPLVNETKRCAAMDVQVHNELHEGEVELFDFEFWPIEHPSEPPDEDHPLKCPMPDSSVINDGGTGRVSESNYNSSMPRKRTEVSSAAFMDEMVDQPPVPVRAVRKRHHTLTRGGGDHIISPLRRMPPHPPRPLPAQSITVFQMLQQLDKS